MSDVTTEVIRLRKGAIHCEGCEATIVRNLSRVPGVQLVKASEAAQTVAVTWDPRVVSAEAVRAKLDEIGYPVERSA